ncbi:putative type VI secretion system protein VgrGA [Hartmannibacter diazotrophicus]|uniref:Putative type VI secretion system protein VgrGA n=1 Tax=Hartmannibacter diazotrophicus TaxID=1482074 RepID=A0A2C9D8J4_9HYPH|nr:type VI secretion system tip protein TssI/VgrG [Hartmannibacter diazotrophicus]SON55875.1 putative type VI secretion system protein VgrGA [Hartmannibacter diazotrophicus]
MASRMRQENQFARLTTQLGPNDFVVVRFDGTEGLNELFEFRIEALCEKENFDFDKLIGTNCTLRIERGDEGPRYFDGILVGASWLGRHDDAHAYRLILRPWIWILGRTTTCRIFKDMTVPDIVEAVLQEKISGQLDLNLSKSYPTLEYCVQYRESDLDFVRRLLEEYGVSFHFKHEPGEHTLVLVDSNSAYKPINGGSRPYRVDLNVTDRDGEFITEWLPGRALTAGKVAYNDYNFKTPTRRMLAEKATSNGYAHGDMELYDYPGRHEDTGKGQPLAEHRLDAEVSRDKRIAAGGTCISACPGQVLTLKQHPNDAQNGDYLILHAEHSVDVAGYRSGTSATALHGSYELIASDQPVAPPLATERPRIYGVQSARVTGSGEIDVDEYGRILCLFFWDRDQTTSMRCRVAQSWAGQNWGSVFIPRVGMEVLVQYLDGDPDRPVVVGAVYNADNMPPYDLPGEKNIAGVKSNSTTGGGGYNELIFDDTAGNELVRGHAQKDMETRIENDERREIGNDQTLTIDGFRKTKIDRSDDLKITQSLKIEAGTSVEIVCGQSKIKMTPADITIESINITVKANGMLNTQGTMAEHKASGPMTIKGAVVLIN